MDENQHPMGGVGFQVDGPSQLVTGIEFVAVDENLRGHLCSSPLRKAEDELGAMVVEVNVSAYDARLQRSFANHGFFPAAYAPAMVFHGTHRLDVVKMLKLNVPYNPASMMLTDSAQTVVSLVENGVKCAAMSSFEQTVRFYYSALGGRMKIAPAVHCRVKMQGNRSPCSGRLMIIARSRRFSAVRSTDWLRCFADPSDESLGYFRSSANAD